MYAVVASYELFSRIALISDLELLSSQNFLNLV